MVTPRLQKYRHRVHGVSNGSRGCSGPHYCEAWKTNGNETSTEPPAGAGKRQRDTSDLMQLATSESPSVSCSMSVPETVPAAVIVQWMTTLPLRVGFRLRARS